MYEEVKPADGDPLLVKKNLIYTQIAVDRVRALDGQEYDVLFLGTGGYWPCAFFLVRGEITAISSLGGFRATLFSLLLRFPKLYD